MARRHNAAHRMGKALACVMCLLALLLSVAPCAMAIQAPQQMPVMAAGTMQCSQCCTDHSTAVGSACCVSRSQPAETQAALELGAMDVQVVSIRPGEQVEAARLRPLPSLVMSQPPPLLHPVLRI